jgi:F-type H+-transporting ATPase subunit delta
MRQTRVAGRYSKALFDLAKETNQVEEVKKDIELIRSVNHDELSKVLVSPVINAEKKVRIFNDVFGANISKLTLSFFDLIFKKGRSVVMPDILQSFDDHYREYKGIKVVELTTAVPMDAAMREDLKTRLQKIPAYANKTVELQEKVDDKIIGGFVAQFGDMLFDASIRHDLQYIKKHFVENMYKQKIR